MSEREQRANAGLRAVQDAYQSGRIDHAEFRRRRRAILQALAEADEVTARSALPGSAPAPVDGGAGVVRAGGHDAELLTMLGSSRWGSLARWGVLSLLAAIVVALLARYGVADATAADATTATGGTMTEATESARSAARRSCTTGGLPPCA
ncbi:hypothetical protein [Coralloluteibacterium thermophilus]|uniref:DUF1707 domain-containing protein n=1 Tax=Coralloluteibacterium thermophilum TaxID=2707049 RepID=A0ABV9NN18_9GAMM